MNDNALIVFTRNPELGKCKTRLAKTIGNSAALDIYKYLLKHTAEISKQIEADRYVFYSEDIIENDIWDKKYFKKQLQSGDDLGKRMLNAFKYLFEIGHSKVIIIGSDLLDLTKDIIDQAIDELDHNEFVFGPAQDGGYYLLGLKSLNEQLFQNKNWGTNTVLKASLKDLSNSKVSLLKELNDIDTLEDIKPYDELKQFYNS